MERLLRRSPEETPPVLPTAESPAISATAPFAAPPTRGSVQIISGALTEAMAVGGMTVADVRALVAAPFNVAPRAHALVDGTRVSSGHRLVAGETLEFVRRTGEKG